MNPFVCGKQKRVHTYCPDAVRDYIRKFTGGKRVEACAILTDVVIEQCNVSTLLSVLSTENPLPTPHLAVSDDPSGGVWRVPGDNKRVSCDI